jgi:hypothetical protein
MEKSSNNNYLEAQLVFDESVSDELKEEIINVLATTKFNKLSYPISTYSYLLFENVENSENKTTVVGYIKKFIKDESKFVFVIYNNSKEIIKSFTDMKIKVKFNEYNGKLGIITKIVVFDNSQN